MHRKRKKYQNIKVLAMDDEIMADVYFCFYGWYKFFSDKMLLL